MVVKMRERKRMYRYPISGILTLLVIVTMAVTAYSGQFEDAVAAYNRKDYATAFRLMKPLAENGNGNAQTNLGFMYFSGQGVGKNYTEAVKWYRRAAEQGHATAQFNLGLMYANGQGVPQDYNESLNWYRRAAEQGYATAQFNLGVMYKAGKGVPKDYVMAHLWFNLAAWRFPESKSKDREDAETLRDLVASKMTPAQIAEAQRLAREWRPKKEVK